MYLPPALVNLALRLFVRLPLGWVKSPQKLRKRFEWDARQVFRTPPGTHVHRQKIPAGDGHIDGLWVSRGRPDRRRIILYLHGGAYLIGSPRTHKHVAAELAARAGMRAFLPAYRLAPEHPFPAAVDDVLAAYAVLLQSYDARNIAVVGDSAGGGLVFSLVLAAQAAGLPPPAAAVGFSPFTDMTFSVPSIRRNVRREVMLSPQRAEEAIDYYLQGHDPRDPLASPAFGTFVDPPPSLLMASNAEMLQDNATLLAEALRRGGGDVRVEIWPGLPHAWPVLTRMLKASCLALDETAAFIRGRMDRTD